MFRASAAVLLASTVLAVPAFASDAETGSDSAEIAELQDPIVVVGQRDEYGVKSTGTATIRFLPTSVMTRMLLVKVVTSVFLGNAKNNAYRTTLMRLGCNDI